jgi:hypothetical protein
VIPLFDVLPPSLRVLALRLRQPLARFFADGCFPSNQVPKPRGGQYTS